MTLPLLNERQRRLVAAAMVAMLGRGGQARVAEATGMSRNTLLAGARELAGGAGPSERVRRPGAGRKRAIDLDPRMSRFLLKSLRVVVPLVMQRLGRGQYRMGV